MEKKQVTRITSLSISGPTYGIGHTSRQNAFLDAAKFEGWETLHLVIEESGPLSPQLDELLDLTKESSCLVIDLDPRFVEEHRLILNAYLGDLRLAAVYKVVMDTESNFPIRDMLNMVKFELAIHPYGAIGVSKNGCELSGFGFSIFSKGLQNIRSAKSYSASNEQKVLVSCGGSDPMNVSSLYLSALNEFSGSNLNIKLVIGQFFSPAQIESLHQLVKNMSHQVEILESPIKLDEAFAFSDLSFVTGGLTRNESMFSGVCTVVTDINQAQFKSTNLFASREAVISLGLLKSGEGDRQNSVALEIISSILSNPKRQKILIENAKMCFPENGASRVLAEIGDVCLKQV